MYLIKRIRFNRFSTVKPTTFQDDYELLQCLGQGSTSRVYLSLDVKTNQKVIVKLFKKLVDKKIQRQSRILKIVSNCNNVQKLRQIVQNAGFMNYGFVFNYYPGEMLNKLVIDSSLQETKTIIRDVLKALKCIHSKQIMHRDIKPSNILISKDPKTQKKKAILIDFGLAQTVDPNEIYKFRVGTNCYKPPEILLKRTHYNQKVDIWGVGLILAEMLLKIKPLFKFIDDERDMLQSLMSKCNHAKQFMKQEDIITFGYKPFKGINQPSLDDQGIKLAMQMMDFNPERRPSAQQALKHRFLMQ